MTSRSLQRRQLSRSKIDLFVECPRCLYLDVARGVRRPSGPPFTLNNAVDALMKAEFDTYRAAGKPHPLFEPAGIDAVPFIHPELDRWRHNFTGVRWKDPETDWTLFGAIDDLWLSSGGELIVADYKATARAEVPTTERLYPSYQRQMDVYQFLVRRQGFEVSDRGWFVYANGDARIGLFDGVLRFSTTDGALRRRGRLGAGRLPARGRDGAVAGDSGARRRLQIPPVRRQRGRHRRLRPFSLRLQQVDQQRVEEFAIAGQAVVLHAGEHRPVGQHQLRIIGMSDP